MLRNSFLFIPGIGEKTEREMWNQGFVSWDDVLATPRPAPTNGISAEEVEGHLSRAEQALNERHVSYFASNLPSNEYWRLFPDFQEETVYLDIESTGLSKVYNTTTVVTTYDGEDIRFFVKGSNLADLAEYLSDYQVLVTYNGKWFDVPFLMEDLPGFTEESVPPVHLDLRSIIRSMGLSGGLKEVEEKLGIERPEHVQQFDGRGATKLWSQFIHGNDEALRNLIEYNIWDTVNLEIVMAEYIEEKFNALIESSEETQQLRIDGGGVVHPSITEAIERSLMDLEIPEKRTRQRKFNVDVRGVPDDNIELGFGDSKLVVDRSQAKGGSVSVGDLCQAENEPLVSVGIDLSGSEDAPSGLCVLTNEVAVVETLSETDDIVNFVRRVSPDIVSIDSPLSLPEGRCCTREDCECEEFGIIREAERELKGRGVNAYPALIDSMRGLTRRGIELAELLEEEGNRVIESYPGAAQDILDIPRKGVGAEELEAGLKNMGIEVENKEPDEVNHHELDAITSALVGHFYLADLYEEVGREGHGIIVPDRNMLQRQVEQWRLAS